MFNIIKIFYLLRISYDFKINIKQSLIHPILNVEHVDLSLWNVCRYWLMVVEKLFFSHAIGCAALRVGQHPGSDRICFCLVFLRPPVCCPGRSRLCKKPNVKKDTLSKVLISTTD